MYVGLNRHWILTAVVIGLVLSCIGCSRSESQSSEIDSPSNTLQRITHFIDQADSEVNPDRRKKIWDKARDEINALLIDPNQDDVEVWKDAGRIALGGGDDELSAFAYEAIDRLRENYAEDEELSEIMEKLNNRPIVDKVRLIPVERYELLSRIQSLDVNRGDHTEEMRLIGHSYSQGNGVPRNDVEAVKWYRKAAREGDADGMYFLGVMYNYGQGITKDVKEAVKWFGKAANKGNTEAMFNLGVMYDYGYGVAQNDKEAKKWYERAALKGNHKAMLALGFKYCLGRGVEKNEAIGLEWFHQSVENGINYLIHHSDDLSSCDETVVRVDNEEVSWLNDMAKSGDTDSMYILGALYEFGIEVEQDFTVTLNWYRKAAEGGNSHAMLNLGILYESEEEVERAEAEAVRWYHQAAKHGNTDAMLYLGFMYDDGRGVDQDYVLATKYFHEGAEGGNAGAMRMYGLMLISGDGISRNITDGLEWLQKAARNGDKKAKGALYSLDRSW